MPPALIPPWPRRTAGLILISRAGPRGGASRAGLGVVIGWRSPGPRSRACGWRAGATCPPGIDYPRCAVIRLMGRAWSAWRSMNFFAQHLPASTSRGHLAGIPWLSVDDHAPGGSSRWDRLAADLSAQAARADGRDARPLGATCVGAAAASFLIDPAARAAGAADLPARRVVAHSTELVAWAPLGMRPGW
jgi:hypothetical protein